MHARTAAALGRRWGLPARSRTAGTCPRLWHGRCGGVRRQRRVRVRRQTSPRVRPDAHRLRRRYAGRRARLPPGPADPSTGGARAVPHDGRGSAPTAPAFSWPAAGTSPTGTAALSIRSTIRSRRTSPRPRAGGSSESWTRMARPACPMAATGDRSAMATTRSRCGTTRPSSCEC